MQLRNIDIANPNVSTVNMRAKGKVDIANILPSVRARGIVAPLMARPNGSPDTFEVAWRAVPCAARSTFLEGRQQCPTT
jgi:ParB family chromosome partitioning protein